MIRVVTAVVVVAVVGGGGYWAGTYVQSREAPEAKHVVTKLAAVINHATVLTQDESSKAAGALFDEHAVGLDVSGDGVQTASGREAITAGYHYMFAVSDWKITRVAAGDGWAVMEWVLSRTNSKTGKAYAVQGASVLTVAHGAITRETDYYNGSLSGL